MSRTATIFLFLAACEGEIDSTEPAGDVDAGYTEEWTDVDAGHWDGSTDDPYEIPGRSAAIVDCVPWSGSTFPLQFLVSLNNPHAVVDPVALLDIQKAASYLNFIACEEIIHIITNPAEVHSTVIEYNTLPEDNDVAWTHCDTSDLCYITTTHQEWLTAHTGMLGPAVFAHEMMHNLGYYSASGDIHDVGFMAQSDIIFDVYPRHRAYLKCLGGKAAKQAGGR